METCLKKIFNLLDHRVAIEKVLIDEACTLIELGEPFYCVRTGFYVKDEYLYDVPVGQVEISFSMEDPRYLSFIVWTARQPDEDDFFVRYLPLSYFDYDFSFKSWFGLMRTARDILARKSERGKEAHNELTL